MWSRSHLGMASITSFISARGRLFTIEDRGSVENPALPGKLTLVLSDEAVYLGAAGAGKASPSLTAFATRDGSQLWSARTRMNHHKPPDIFLTGGAVWTANNKAHDPLTGKPIKTLSQKTTGPMGHDRCYQNRITEKWYINTVSGGSDFLALDGSGEFPTPWGRSTCGIGHLPCNGLLYLGPPACSCGNKVQLISLNALSAAPGLKSSGQPLNIPVNPRLEKGPAYFAAGRNSYVDGGIFLFGLDPQTGRMIHQKNLYGPHDQAGHPVISKITALGGTGAGGVQGNKGDVLLARGEHLLLRHQAFQKNLDPVGPGERILPHLITTHGFAERTPHHRSFWTIDTELYYDRWTANLGVRGDIAVMDGARYYDVRGYPPGRYTTYDVRENAYTIFAGELSSEMPQKAAQREYKELWQAKIPLTGKALALAADVLFVAGTPAVFPEGDLAKAYEGRMGGVLWACSAKDDRKLREYRLDAAPEWDTLAAAEGHLFLCTTDGRVHCFAGKH